MENTSSGMSIGALAQAAGVHVETIRFYQLKGLLRTPGRPAQGRGGSVPLNTWQRFLKWIGCGFVCRGAGLSPAAASLATNASRGG